MTATDNEIAEAMIAMGGSFTSMLGRLLLLADGVNQAKLKAAFPEYWERYEELATLKAKRDAQPSAYVEPR